MNEHFLAAEAMDSYESIIKTLSEENEKVALIIIISVCKRVLDDICKNPTYSSNKEQIKEQFIETLKKSLN